MKNKLLKVLSIFLICIFCFTLTACNSTEDNKEQVKKEEKKEENKEEKYMTGKHNVKIEIEDYGDIELELDADVAPITVTNFIDLVNDKFYDGLTFHRIIDGFMIQGGDPKGNGTGGSEKKIKGEFAKNGIENNISHKRGVISMARATAMDSASSQFFIVHEDSEFLDGSYAGFGHVTKGMDVVDKICEKAKPVDSNGSISKDEQPKIKRIIVID